MNLQPFLGRTDANPRDKEPATVGPGPRRISVAWSVGAAILAAALVLVACGIGLMRGSLAILALGALWVVIPSARTLSRRLALNGAIALGGLPVLWWIKWPQFGEIGHVAVVLAALSGVAIFRLVRSAPARHTLLPRISRRDLIPVGAAAAAGWFFLPFLKVHSGIGSIAQLINGFGNDNVAHFNMYSMIRRNGVEGLAWAPPPDGSAFAYTSYPQHFHALVAFAAELWHGPSIGTVDVETGLYGLGTAIVLSSAFVTVVATITSARPLKGHPGIALVVSAGAFSVLLLGLGSDSLRFGFPGFLLAVLGAVACCIVAAGKRTTGILTLLAAALLLVLVAHSWSLLTPLPGTAFVFASLRLPWARYRARLVSAVPAVLILLFATGGVIYAAVLVFLATKSVGSAESVLAIGVPFAIVSVTFPAAIVCAILAISASWISRSPLGRSRIHVKPSNQWIVKTNTSLVFSSVAVVASIETAALIAVQLRESPALSYYQYKFIYGATMILAILLMTLAGAWATRRRAVPKRVLNRVLAALCVGILALGLTTYSGVAKVPSPALVAMKAPGVTFRDDLMIAAASADSSTNRLMRAATIMQSWPCDRPVYVAGVAGDLPNEQANQWAMSFSGTWTGLAGPINTFMFELHATPTKDSASYIVNALLSQSKARCVILAPQAKVEVNPTVMQRFGDRILSW